MSGLFDGSVRYTGEEQNHIAVTVAEGFVLGNMAGPIEFFMAIPSSGNREYDALMKLIESSEVVIAPYQVPPISLPDISDRQFGRGLWGEKVITFDECEQFVSVGAIPAALQAIIDQLPDDDTGAPTPRKEAVILVKGAKSYSFANPLVETVRAFLAASDAKWTEDYLRERWAEWVTL